MTGSVESRNGSSGLLMEGENGAKVWMKQFVCPKGQLGWRRRESKWFIRLTDGRGEWSKGVNEAVRLPQRSVRLAASRVEKVVRPSDGREEWSKGVNEAVRLPKRSARLVASRVEKVVRPSDGREEWGKGSDERITFNLNVTLGGAVFDS
ncbi:hypothetical protein LQV63_06585 [Paenibacillus profundus]|uniref:Uncharacterized protein n=1 Tax=Paenibacillus profundus TaxID=1173085 RepID=A0ABS8YCM4_9BACL|nr:hypothetical protein [Paenibacillus profundus]MCE5168974.1 hypothetical protein [Paenibacillus profundus]